MPKKNRDNVFRARTRKLPDDKSIQVDVASKPGKPGKPTGERNRRRRRLTRIPRAE